jgi:hypothetical protein
MTLSAQILKMRGAALSHAAAVCMRDMFILNEIWVQDKIYNLVGILLC